MDPDIINERVFATFSFTNPQVTIIGDQVTKVAAYPVALQILSRTTINAENVMQNNDIMLANVYVQGNEGLDKTFTTRIVTVTVNGAPQEGLAPREILAKAVEATAKAIVTVANLAVEIACTE